MMQITFSGSAIEILDEMRTLLGFDVQSIKQEAFRLKPEDLSKLNETFKQIDEAMGGDSEPKRGRGRPRKVDSVATEPTPEAAPIEEVTLVASPTHEPEVMRVITYTPEDQAAAKAALEVLKEVVAPEPEPVAEQTGAPCPSNAQDLMTAAMEIVKGDSAKKIALVKLLGSFGAKTINTLSAENYAEFWAKVNAL